MWSSYFKLSKKKMRKKMFPTCVAIIKDIKLSIWCRWVIPEDEVIYVWVVDCHFSVYIDW